MGSASLYEEVRAAGKAFAQLIQRVSPPSREQSLALTDIQRAVQMSNAAIAINEQEPISSTPAPVQETAAAQSAATTQESN